MSYLDKQVMYFFRQEIEKQALMGEVLVSTGQIVANAGKAAAKGAQEYGKAMTNMAAIGSKGPLTAKDYAGGVLLGGGGIYAGTKGLQSAKQNYTKDQIQIQQQTGNQQI